MSVYLTGRGSKCAAEAEGEHGSGPTAILNPPPPWR